jgi:hypothetical protein
MVRAFGRLQAATAGVPTDAVSWTRAMAQDFGAFAYAQAASVIIFGNAVRADPAFHRTSSSASSGWSFFALNVVVAHLAGTVVAPLRRQCWMPAGRGGLARWPGEPCGGPPVTATRRDK